MYFKDYTTGYSIFSYHNYVMRHIIGFIEIFSFVFGRQKSQYTKSPFNYI